MKKTKLSTIIIALILLLSLLGSCATEEVKPAHTEPAFTETQENTAETKEDTTEQEQTAEDTAIPPVSTQPADTDTPQGGAGQGQYVPLNLADIPAYSGSAYVSIQGGTPNFSPEELKNVGYESYSSLDHLGRTRTALASVGKDTMPKAGEERGSISSIRPSGWVQAKYDHVSGKYLYNRCHLIGWQLSAENANPRNLLTGTKYLNVTGMLPFENMVADYIKETGNHVAYRITPIYEGDNLVASGVEMEAFSVEDNGDGICFHVYCYNVQPGVTINYASGASSLSSTPATTTTARPTTTKATATTGAQSSQTVFVTRSGKRYHSSTACRGLANANSISETSLSDATARGLTPCSICW